MSNFNDLKAYALGSHNWFFPEGAAITSPAAGVVSESNWPDSDEPTWDARYVGDTEDWNGKKTVESEEVFKPNPGVLTRKQIVNFYQSLDFEVTTNALRRVALRMMFGGDTELEEGVAEFAPLSQEPLTGLWVSRNYTQQNEEVLKINMWAQVDVQEIASGNKKLVKPKFMIKCLENAQNIIRFGRPEDVNP